MKKPALTLILIMQIEVNIINLNMNESDKTVGKAEFVARPNRPSGGKQKTAELFMGFTVMCCLRPFPEHFCSIVMSPQQ